MWFGFGLLRFANMYCRDYPPSHSRCNVLYTSKGKVYDISGWKGHPGGRVLFSHVGEDCTDIFTAFHPASSYNVLSRFLIGELDKPSLEELTNKREELQKAYRRLRIQLMAAGLFKRNEFLMVGMACTFKVVILRCCAVVVKMIIRS